MQKKIMNTKAIRENKLTGMIILCFSEEANINTIPDNSKYSVNE